MDPNDKELKDQLARDPFNRSGFNERLRRRIEERIDQEHIRSRRPWRYTWRLPAAAFASIAVVWLAIWLWNGLSGDGHLPDTAADRIAAGQVSAAPPNASAALQPKKYALLVGLRTDQRQKSEQGDSFPTSTYRTVLVAPEGSTSQQRLMADRAGLYLPYGQNFWQIATVPESGGRQVLQAIQITNRKIKTFKELLPPPDNLLSERVLFAGNRYLSVSSTVRDDKGGQTANQWVKMIDQIDGKSADPETEPHVRLEGVLPDKVAHPPVEQWSVVRNPGQWMADVPDVSAESAGEENFPAALPPVVVNRDSLLMSWDDILQIEPGAQDAFTYGNLLGVVAGSQIRVHVMKDGKPLPATVTIPLTQGESVVMIQWAQDNYVDNWIQVMRSLPGRS